MKEKIRYYINYKMKERVESIFEGISNGRKKALNSWFEDQWIKIDSIKKSLILMTESKESFTELLVELKERYQTFIELFILDEHGDIIASSFARHIGDNIKEFPNFKKGLAGECYMYGPYCDKKTLDLDLTGKPFYDEVTLLFSAPYKNNDQVRILCVRVLNDDMSNVIQEEDTHVYKDSGDNYLFMIQNNRGIETGTAISRSRFEDKTFTKGDNLKDGIKTKKWGEVKIKEHTEFEILFSDPATNSLHQGVQYTINNKENLDCGPGYPDYRHILVGGKGTIITPPHSDEVWGMMCEGDIADIYNFTSLSSKLSMQIGMITLVTTIILELFHSYVKSMVRIGDIFLWLITFLGAYLITKYTVVKPMVKTINLLRTIAEGEGDLTKRVDVQRSNEIGELARWFNKFVSNQMNMIKRIKTSIKTTKGTTKQVSKSSKKIEESINIIGETVTTLSKHSIEQNKLFKNTQHEVKKIANTFEKNEELELLINDIMNKTDSTNQAAATASSVKEEVMINISDLETSMVNAISNISSLESKSNEITKIISTITEISDQTNLLALNATIEAARAGEVGKGFSVVADEIKKLSTDTYHATFMVTELVSSIQSEIKNTNQNIEAIDEKVKASIKSSKESAEAVELVIQVSNTISYILNIMREQNNVIKEVQHNIFEMAKQSEESTVIGEMNSNHALESVEDIMKQVGKLNQVLESLEYSAEDLDKMVGAFVVHVKDN